MFVSSTKAPGVFGFPFMHVMGRLGGWVWAQWDELRHAAAVIGTVLCVCVQPRYWARTARKAFARQVLSIGVEPLSFVGAVAVFVGISVLVQLTFGPAKRDSRSCSGRCWWPSWPVNSDRC